MRFRLAGRKWWYFVATFAILTVVSVGITRAQVADQTNAAADSTPPTPSSKTPNQKIVALIGGEIRTCDDAGTISNGVVLIEDGKIIGVGDQSLEIPDGAEKVDISGGILTPGLIDSRSTLWLTDAAANTSGSDSSLQVVDGIDPYSDDWQEVIRHGVTAAYIQTARSGTLGGYGAVVSVAPEAPGKPLVLASNAALQASLGIGAGNNRSRLQQFERTKKVLESAVAYKKQWKEYNDYIAKQEKAKEKDSKANESESKKDVEAKPEATRPGPGGRSGQFPGGGSRGGRPGFGRPISNAEPPAEPAKQPDASETKKEPEKSDAAEEKPPKKPEQDPIKDRLVKVLEGEIPLRLEIHSVDDVTFALKLIEIEDFKNLQVVFEGLSDLRSGSAQLSETNFPLVLGPWLAAEPLSDAAKSSPKHWGQNFASYKGAMAIATFGSRPTSSRLLRAHAARAIANGVSPERALQAVTIDAARTLGVAATIGSIAKGKRADLVCFRGGPLDTSSPIELVTSGGKIVYRSSIEPAADSDKKPSETNLTFADIELPTVMPDRYALKSSRVLIDGALVSAVVFVANSKIEIVAVGNVDVEDGINLFDLNDSVITPGLFSAHATLGLGRLIDPQDVTDASYVIAADCIGTELDKKSELVNSGLLHVLLSPGSGNPVSGSASLIRVAGDEKSLLRNAASKIVISSKSRNRDRFPSSLTGQIQLLQQSLDGSLLESRIFVPASVERNLEARRKEALSSIINGNRLTIIEAETDAEIRSALDLIEQYHLRAALSGCNQLKPFIDRIRDLGVTVIAHPIAIQSYNWYAEDLAAASKAGIPVVFEGETAEELRLCASMAVESGMSPLTALASLCEPKKLLGGEIKNSIASNANADLVVWSGSPVNLGATPLLVLVDGKIATVKDDQ